MRGFAGSGASQLQMFLLSRGCTSTKDFMQLISRHFGVDAMLQDWTTFRNSKGKLQLWVFPPFYLAGQGSGNCSCTEDANLLLPACVCYWTAMLSSLPIHDECCLPYHSRMYILGSRLPPSMQQSGCPFTLKAYWVKF